MTTTKQKTKDLTKLTAVEQIRVLENLTQAAAARLVGVSPRTLRDHPEIPQTPAKRYDARDLLRWLSHRVEQPELDDADLERILVIAERLESEVCGEALLSSVSDAFQQLQQKYGQAALLAFSLALIERCDKRAESCRRFHQSPEQVRQAEEHRRQEEAARRQREAEEAARDQLKVCVVCECGRLRRGRTWVNESPPPGYAVELDYCPTCKKKGG